MTQETKTGTEETVQPKEGAEATQPKEEATVKTYTEADLQRAVNKGLESTTKQLSLRQAEAKKAKAEAEQFKAGQELLKAELQEAQVGYDKLVQGIEDPEEKEKLLSRVSLARERQQIAREKAEVKQARYESEKQVWSARMAQKAGELVKESGISVGELEGCQTEEEMEVKALRFELAKKPETKVEEKPEFDSVTSTPGGGTGFTMDSINKMSAEEFNKKEKEILEASRQGKIK